MFFNPSGFTVCCLYEDRVGVPHRFVHTGADVWSKVKSVRKRFDEANRIRGSPQEAAEQWNVCYFLCQIVSLLILTFFFINVLTFMMLSEHLSQQETLKLSGGGLGGWIFRSSSLDDMIELNICVFWKMINWVYACLSPSLYSLSVTVFLFLFPLSLLFSFSFILSNRKRLKVTVNTLNVTFKVAWLS